MLEYNIRENFCTKGPRIRGKSKRFKKVNKTDRCGDPFSISPGLAGIGAAMSNIARAKYEHHASDVYSKACEQAYKYQMRQAEQASKYTQSSGLSGYAAASAGQAFGDWRSVFGGVV